MDETAGNTGNEQLVGNDELDDGVEFLFPPFKHSVELLSLRDCSRETVEYEARKKGKGSVRKCSPKELHACDVRRVCDVHGGGRTRSCRPCYFPADP